MDYFNQKAFKVIYGKLVSEVISNLEIGLETILLVVSDFYVFEFSSMIKHIIFLLFVTKGSIICINLLFISPKTFPIALPAFAWLELSFYFEVFLILRVFLWL